MQLLMTAHLGVTPTCAEARAGFSQRWCFCPTQTNRTTAEGINMFTKRKLIKRIERMMVEQELELHDLDSQHSRAYHSGIIDGLGMALYEVSPVVARRNPISIVWFDEDYDETRMTERYREEAFDAINDTSIFETAESK
jgi:hypothetical protein